SRAFMGARQHSGGAGASVARDACPAAIPPPRDGRSRPPSTPLRHLLRMAITPPSPCDFVSRRVVAEPGGGGRLRDREAQRLEGPEHRVATRRDRALVMSRSDSVMPRRAPP